MVFQGQLVDKRLLSRLKPLDALAASAIEELAAKTRVEELPRGRQLFAQGQSDNWTYYLLDGAVELAAPSGTHERIAGNTASALAPLAPSRPRKLSATALTPIRFIRIDNDLLELLQASGKTATIDVGEITEEDESIENRLFYQIYRDYMENNLDLPSIPDVALRVNKVAQDPDKGIPDIARIVQTDPALAARLVQVANSPLYRGQSAVGNVQNAITRLGLDATRSLVMSFSLRQLFKSRHQALRQRMAELWQHSAKVAAISFVLARLTPGFDPDRALLAGLIHDIGILPVIKQVEQYPDLVADQAGLERAIAELRGQIGAMLLRQWKMPSDLVGVTLDSENWMRDPDKNADLCDIVMVAQMHSFIGTPRMHSCPRIDTVPAFGKLALGRLTPKLSIEILERSKAEINEMLRLLQG